jgi:type III pantothenate kinase
MILLVDAGNTRSKWRIVDAGMHSASGVVLSVHVQDLAQAWQTYRFNRAIVSCVAAAEIRDRLAQILATRCDAVQWLLPEREKYGLINRYTAPEQLGADRYAALIAAQRLKLGDCLVVSVGTATTVDMLYQDREFLGGVIIPGPDLMATSLCRETAQIENRMQFSETNTPDINAMPRDTAHAVDLGIALAQAGVVHALCERMARMGAAAPKVVLTGGARRKIRDYLQVELIEIEDLVLEGLAWIALA